MPSHWACAIKHGLAGQFGCLCGFVACWSSFLREQVSASALPKLCHLGMNPLSCMPLMLRPLPFYSAWLLLRLSPPEHLHSCVSLLITVFITAQCARPRHSKLGWQSIIAACCIVLLIRSFTGRADPAMRPRAGYEPPHQAGGGWCGMAVW